MGDLDTLGQAIMHPEDPNRLIPRGEKPYREAGESADAAEKWRKYRDTGEVAKAVAERPQIVTGEVDAQPFTRERRRTNGWYKGMQNKVQNLLGYINDPNIQVRCNFPNLDVPQYMKTFFRFAHAFSKMKVNNRADWRDTRDQIEALAEKNGLRPVDVLYGQASLFQLAYATDKARKRINNKTQILDLKLKNMGERTYALEYAGAPKAKAAPVYSQGRPIPDAMPERDAVAGTFDNLNINGEPVDVRITGQISDSDIFTGVISSHSTGGGHNYFEFRMGKGGMIEGVSRWKKATARSSAEFIRKVLEINAAMDDLAEVQHDAYQKGLPLPADTSGYVTKTPEQVKRNVDFMILKLKQKAAKENGLSDREIAGAVNMGILSGEEDWIHPGYYATVKDHPVDDKGLRSGEVRIEHPDDKA